VAQVISSCTKKNSPIWTRVAWLRFNDFCDENGQFSLIRPKACPVSQDAISRVWTGAASVAISNPLSINILGGGTRAVMAFCETERPPGNSKLSRGSHALQSVAYKRCRRAGRVLRQLGDSPPGTAESNLRQKSQAKGRRSEA